MTDMDKHASTGSGLRRARIAAWIVFLSMAGTTMTFQVYHSIQVGRMPPALAVLFGVIPLLISICILEIVAEWRGSPWWAKAAAYLIMGGSMFMSASATGDVVLHAAPPHWSLLFGLLLDAAALLAVHFLLSGSPALAQAMTEEGAARQAALEAERAAAEAGRIAKAAAEAERDTVKAEASAALEAVRGELAEAVAKAEAEAAKTETLARKLAGNDTRKRAGTTARKAPRKPAGTTGRKEPTATAPEGTPEETADLDAEARVLQYLAEGMSASEAGRKAGLSDSRGRQIARKLAKTAPEGIDIEPPAQGS